jgi:hypothetical protein
LGVRIDATPGTYLVLKNANVRATPETSGRRVGKVSAGQRVEVLGRAKKAAWLAVRQDGKDFGFIYAPILMPVIDGHLTTRLTGTLAGPRHECDYSIDFAGKSPAQGQPFEFADYDVFWNCRQGVRQATFLTPMFLTEGPYRGGRKPLHQITIDILDMITNEAADEATDEVADKKEAEDENDIFSTHMFWDRKQERLRFDSASIERFGRAPAVRELPAPDIPSALRAAVRLAHAAWTPRLWKILMAGNVQER